MLIPYSRFHSKIIQDLARVQAIDFPRFVKIPRSAKIMQDLLRFQDVDFQDVLSLQEHFKSSDFYEYFKTLFSETFKVLISKCGIVAFGGHGHV